MDSGSDDSGNQSTRNPLIPVGLTVLGILILPMFLYSNAPNGPIKEGDVVFSTGRHRVHFDQPSRSTAQEPQHFCILEPRAQLLVTQRPAARTDGSLLAHPLGTTKSEFPLCPSNANLILHPHQVTLQVDTWGGIKDTLTSLF